MKSAFRNRYARRLRQEALMAGPATMPGRLYRIRWYPGMRPPVDSEDLVSGEIFRLRQPGRLLAALDEYEGRHLYTRELHAATLANGRRLRCWVYMYRVALTESRRMPSGEWDPVAR